VAGGSGSAPAEEGEEAPPEAIIVRASAMTEVIEMILLREKAEQRRHAYASADERGRARVSLDVLKPCCAARADTG